MRANRTDLLGRQERPPQGTRLLIVDDEPAMRHLLQKFFASEGYATEVAEDVADAHAHIAAKTPAVVLLDLMMPGQTGLDFLRTRKDDTLLRTVPVIVLSAVMRDNGAEARALGATACVDKPFDLDILSAVVRACVSQTPS